MHPKKRNSGYGSGINKIMVIAKPEEMFEITPGHFVLTTKEQAEIWKNSLS